MTPIQMLRDLSAKRQSEHEYRARARQLTLDADRLCADGFTHWAGEVRLFAFIAANAARAEALDPEPQGVSHEDR